MSNIGKQSGDPDCAAFQERMPSLFESGEDFSKDAHLESCENCAELVRDLNYIAEQAKFLANLHDPAPAVWEHIREAIETGSEASAKG